MNKKFIAALVSSSAMLFASLAIAAGNVSISSVASKVVADKLDDGSVIETLIPAEKVLPGENVLYTTTFTNISHKAADDIVITNPIPEHTSYIDNSAVGEGSRISYSVDGGRSWGQANQLKVRGNDGRWYLAEASNYTHIRWVYQRDLMPGEKGEAYFRVKLK